MKKRIFLQTLVTAIVYIAIGIGIGYAVGTDHAKTRILTELSK